MSQQIKWCFLDVKLEQNHANYCRKYTTKEGVELPANLLEEDSIYNDSSRMEDEHYHL